MLCPLEMTNPLARSELTFGEADADVDHGELEALAWDPLSLEFVSAQYRDNDEIVKFAVKRNGCALEFASPRLQNNREVVATAVAQNGGALAHASGQLRSDRCMVMLALRQTGRALEFASTDIQDEILRDKDLLQNIFSEQCILRVAMLSGHSCLFVATQGDTRRTLLNRCAARLHSQPSTQFPREFLLRNAKLMVGDSLAPTTPILDWPGVCRGAVTQIQIVLKGR
mmetsp:Transcript_52085/g.124023  ORF Transcript_52085/g.124023 Transcript_52085/m.124023 type:complete len:227 (+) Transcript_52085:83-763(+)